MEIFQILMLVVQAAFTALIFVLGRELISIKSLADELKKYRQEKASRTFTKSWFFWWKFTFAQQVTSWFLKKIGDRFYSGFLRAAGWFFLTAALFFVVGIGMQIYWLVSA